MIYDLYELIWYQMILIIFDIDDVTEIMIPWCQGCMFNSTTGNLLIIYSTIYMIWLDTSLIKMSLRCVITVQYLRCDMCEFIWTSMALVIDSVIHDSDGNGVILSTSYPAYPYISHLYGSYSHRRVVSVELINKWCCGVFNVEIRVSERCKLLTFQQFYYKYLWFLTNRSV